MNKLPLFLSTLLSLTVAQDNYMISVDQQTHEYNEGCRDNIKNGLSIHDVFLGGDQPRKLSIPTFCCSDYYIRFSNSSLPTLAISSFGSRNGYISGITMKKSNISEIVPGTFKVLRYLNCLDLSHNNFSAIKNGIFNGVEHLYDLNLANNNIKYIFENAFDNTPLRNLFLQNNVISFLENKLFWWQTFTLDFIDLRNNSLKDINNTFIALDLLSTLYLDKNNLEVVDIVAVPSTEIHLRNNNISRIKSLAEKTKVIDLGENNISLFENFGSAFINSSILKLYLSYNQIQLSEKSFSSIPNLTHLHLDNNKLSKIPNNVFKDLKSLILLDISHNNILQLQYGTFELIPNIEVLNISHNKFTEVPIQVFSPLPKLKELDFRQNQVDTLDVKVFLWYCPNLQKINLNGNLWECEILSNIVKYCQDKNIEIVIGNLTEFDNVRGNACYNKDFDADSNSTLTNQTVISLDSLNDSSLFKFFNEYLNSVNTSSYDFFNKDFQYRNTHVPFIVSVMFILFSIFISLLAILSGFRPIHSCTIALLKITNDILAATDTGDISLLILLDYTVKMMQEYFTNRHQMVKLKGELAESVKLLRGVPQRSIFGPLLFSLYTSNILTKINLCKYHAYADDAKLYVSFKSELLNEAVADINTELQNIYDSSVKHEPKQNPNKTQVLMFGPKLLCQKALLMKRGEMYRVLICLTALFSLTACEAYYYTIAWTEYIHEIDKDCKGNIGPGTNIHDLFFVDDRPRNLSYPTFCCSDYYIRFSNSSVPTMATFTFGTRPQYIKGVTMSNTNISKILPGTFKELENLNCLDLSHNNLRMIKEGIFNGSTHLQDLNLSNNNIIYISEKAFEKTPLRNLFLQNNMLSSMENNLFSWQRLTLISINLSNNFLRVINDTFIDMNSLMTLNLNQNNIDIVDMASVHSIEIHLRNNNVSQVKALAKKTKLIDFGGNNIHSLEDSSNGFINSSVLELYLSRNGIQLSENSFVSIANLTHLHLDNNNISEILSSAFRPLRALVFLDLSHNNIVQFQYGTFELMSNIQYLNISYNNLTELQIQLYSSLGKLKEIDFRRNQVSKLDVETLLSHCPYLQKINLNENIWKCETLTNIVKYCGDKNVDVVAGNSTDFDNVRGNPCFNGDLEMNEYDDNEVFENNHFYEYLLSLKLGRDLHYKNSVINNLFNKYFENNIVSKNVHPLIFSIPVSLSLIFILLVGMIVLFLKKSTLFLHFVHHRM
ncbi:uncharacterized protein [Leptinotarsa decemlineata]|uniref:uncharacterized protein n=1 Tax=Leptinotarsa decemlineata TaxID=7539 RepID=UPI003D3097C4